MRETNQRLKIVEYLESTDTHPSAEEIYEHVSQTLPKITLSTVYRNLNRLTEEGFVKRMSVNKEYRFDARKEDHQHFICNSCGKVEDIFQPEINRFAMNKVDADAETVSITFRGICRECKQRI